jgi:cytochrome b561
MIDSFDQNPVFYSRLQRRLHWLVLILLLVQYALQLPMRAAMAAIDDQETLTFVQFLVTTVHTWGGVSIAALMCWRWQLRKRAVPPAAGQLSPFRSKWVKAHHVTLYAVLILMALSGTCHYYLGWALAARWHELGKWLLLVLIGVHIAGAISHLGNGNRVLQRMMGRNSLR